MEHEFMIMMDCETLEDSLSEIVLVVLDVLDLKHKCPNLKKKLLVMQERLENAIENLHKHIPHDREQLHYDTGLH
jgi:hypothetical protein